MKRVVVTGMGIVSCLGNDTRTVTEALREGQSGIRFVQAYKEIGLRSQIAGTLQIDPADHLDRKTLRFMGNAAIFAYISMDQAIKDAGLGPDQVSNPRIWAVSTCRTTTRNWAMRCWSVPRRLKRTQTSKHTQQHFKVR